MSRCTGCGNNNFDALRPNLVCAPDLSQLLFRFLGNRLGIVKGTAELLSIDMSSFFMPLNGYSMSSLTLCPGDTSKIESGASMDYGKRREIHQFDINDLPDNIELGPSTKANIIIELNGSMFGSMLGIQMDNYETLIDNIDSGIKGDQALNSKLSLGPTDGVSIFSLIGKNKGDEFTFTVDVTDNTNNNTAILESTITQTAYRYPSGALKLLLINIKFCATCVKPNKQYIEWAYASDVEDNGMENAAWKKTGPLILQTGAEDVTEEDMNMIETIYVRNMGSCDVELQTILSI